MQPIFLASVLFGLCAFVLANAAVATPAQASLGGDIVCYVFSDLNSFGTPIPHLSSGSCSEGSVPQSQTGVLVVKKVVSGGTATPDQFSFSINGASAIAFNVAGENDIAVATGTPYSVVETATSTYTASYDNCASVMVAAGATSTCTITNTYVPPVVAPPATTSDLSLTKSVDNASPAEGGQVTYTLTVHNAGPDAAAGVVVADLLPSGLVYVSDDGAGAYNPGTGVWAVGAVGTTSDAVLHITATVGDTTLPVLNTASITSDESADPNSDNNASSAGVTPVAPDNAGSDTSGGSTSGDSNTGGSSNAAADNSGGGGGGGVLGGALSVGYQNGGGGGGIVLGTSTEDASVATSCSPYLTSYLRIGKNNNPDEVTKLQAFLNSYLGTHLPVTGFFGPLTLTAVKQFQLRESANVLAPWVPYGLPNAQTATGYVYKTTQRWINELQCGSLNLPLPQLP